MRVYARVGILRTLPPPAPEAVTRLHRTARALDVEWPPLHVQLEARPVGETITFHVFVTNHEPELVRDLTIKAAVPENASLVDTWAGSPNHHRGTFDGRIVTWNDPEAGVVARVSQHVPCRRTYDETRRWPPQSRQRS